MEGRKLIENISLLTGLPYKLVERELQGLVIKSSENPNSVSLAQVREILSRYLQDVLVEAKNENQIKAAK